MNRIATFVAVLALCNVSRGTLIDLIDTPSALPSDKPSSVQVPVQQTIGGTTFIAQLVTLDAVELDTETNQVTYYQLTPIHWWCTDGELWLSDLSSVLDPTGSFSASFTDFGAPSVFTTSFLFPAFSPTLYNTVSFSGSVSGSVTDSTTIANGVSYSPTGGNAGVFKYELFDTTNAPLASFFLDPGASFGTGPPNTHATGPFDNSGSPLLVAAGPNGVGTVVVTSSFTGSGGTDHYAFTGRWDVEVYSNNVPEPSTLVLVCFGVAGFGALAIRKRRVRWAG